LEGLGISSYSTVHPHTVEEIITSLKKLSDVLGVPEAGASVAREMQRRLADLQQRVGALAAKRVLSLFGLSRAHLRWQGHLYRGCVAPRGGRLHRGFRARMAAGSLEEVARLAT